jgi:hypothetical protein
VTTSVGRSHDLGRDRAQLVPGNPTILHLHGLVFQPLFWPFYRTGWARRMCDPLHHDVTAAGPEVLCECPHSNRSDYPLARRYKVSPCLGAARGQVADSLAACLVKTPLSR